jgi:ankyrin repeat protein
MGYRYPRLALTCSVSAQGSSMAVEYLLLNGAKINAQDGDGKTPLHIATELGTLTSKPKEI